MQCKDCGQIKVPDAFYASNKSRCKECVKARVRKNRADNADYYRAYDRARAWLPERVLARKAHQERVKTDPDLKARDRENRARWQQRHAIKRNCHVVVGNAIRDGKLTPQPCERCGADEHIHAHHEDYTKPLDVNWLCRTCHGIRHREINERRRAA